eukprot:Sspe_Gene.118946::Locus_113564_Transcript_1_1_Confidence_1.000_Length_757::g.118946::m.118946
MAHSHYLVVLADIGAVEEVKEALARGASIGKPWSAKDGEFFNPGTTALMACSRSGHLAIARLLIDNGADVNQQDAEHWNALHYACFSGHADIARLLLQHGCDASVATLFEKATPLQFALHRRFAETTEVFGEPPPPPLTGEARAAAITKALRKLEGSRCNDSGATLLKRYAVDSEGLGAWKGYLESGATEPTALAAHDKLIGERVTIHLYPTLPRPALESTIRQSSVSGVQHFTV